MNNVVLVGRLTKDPEIVEKENKKLTSITVAVMRNFKNSEGKYDSDFIRCTLWNGIAVNTTEYCKKGDVVGIKGRLQSSVYEDDEQNKIYSMEVIAERVTFLTSRKEIIDEDIKNEKKE